MKQFLPTLIFDCNSSVTEVNDTTWMSRILPLAGAETVLKLKAPQE
jgi:hypothetical protein